MPKKKRQEAPPELVSTAQAAAILNRHVRSVHRLIATGALVPAVKIPGKTGAYLFNRADVEALAGRHVA